MSIERQDVYRMKGVTVKLVLLVVAIVLWTIAAICAIATASLGSLGGVDFLLLGAPFFAASFLPIP